MGQETKSLELSSIKTLEDAFEVIKVLLVENQQLRTRITKLEEEMAVLKKNSSTSSKPPSSDITKPQSKRRQPGKRKIGGQKGQSGSSRKKFSTDEVDDFVKLPCSECPDCGSDLSDTATIGAIKDQCAELVEKPVLVTEYQREIKQCNCCNQKVSATLPDGVIEGQLFGIRLQSLMGYMKGHIGCSYTELSQYCEDVLGIRASRAMLSDIVTRVSQALETPYEELKSAISEQKSLNIDESGWKDNGKRFWVWIFCNQMIAFFTISATRGAVVLRETLGEVFSGAITSDFFSAYTSYANGMQQWCLAHLIRDIKFLTTLPDEQSQQFGKKVLTYFKMIFRLWHRRSSMPPEQFLEKAQRIKTTLHNYINRTQLPKKSKASTLQKRIIKRWNSLFIFLEYPQLFQPTNNNAEQTLRHMVRIRRHTQGSRSKKGRVWIERVMSVLESCRKQKRSPWDFILHSMQAQQGYRDFPSILAA